MAPKSETPKLKKTKFKKGGSKSRAANKFFCSFGQGAPKSYREAKKS
jgi:hypothetical protein